MCSCKRRDTVGCVQHGPVSDQLYCHPVHKVGAVRPHLRWWLAQARPHDRDQRRARRQELPGARSEMLLVVQKGSYYVKVFYVRYGEKDTMVRVHDEEGAVVQQLAEHQVQFRTPSS